MQSLHRIQGIDESALRFATRCGTTKTSNANAAPTIAISINAP